MLGKKDNYISFDVMYPVAKKSPTGEILVLENSGHMGFVEEGGICLDVLKSFAMKHH